MFGLKKITSKKILFVPDNEFIDSVGMPKPSSSLIPEWFKKTAPHSYKNNGYHDYVKLNKDMLKNGGSWNSTFKHCLPFVDALTSGYTITTPSDLLVIKNEDGSPYIKWFTSNEIIDNQDISVIGKNFKIPSEYHQIVFRWTNEWKIVVPNNYSVLFTHPMNRLDLPFFTLSGVVDCDLHPNSVFVPFFLRKDFEGVIPAGTPIIQVLPFKRESWFSKKGAINAMSKISSDLVKRYVMHNYRRLYWSKKSYK